MKDPAIINELLKLKREDGLILPKDVVEAARSPKSPLHASFTWDNTKAAAEYRLWQARTLLRICVVMLPQNTQVTKAFVSLSSEVGYRSIEQVLSVKIQRETMLDDAMDELERVRAKYNHLKELVGVFEVIASRVKTLRAKTARRE